MMKKTKISILASVMFVAMTSYSTNVGWLFSEPAPKTVVDMIKALPSLEDWTIHIINGTIEEKCWARIDGEKLATIKIDKSPQCAVHEMLHVAVRAAAMDQGNDGTEEAVVRDLTRIILKK